MYAHKIYLPHSLTHFYRDCKYVDDRLPLLLPIIRILNIQYFNFFWTYCRFPYKNSLRYGNNSSSSFPGVIEIILQFDQKMACLKIVQIQDFFEI